MQLVHCYCIQQHVCMHVRMYLACQTLYYDVHRYIHVVTVQNMYTHSIYIYTGCESIMYSILHVSMNIVPALVPWVVVYDSLEY